MVSVSVPGMYGWGNPSGPAARRPWIVSLPQERFRGAFFCGKTALFRPPLVNKDTAFQTARCPNDQGQCGACPLGLDRCCQTVVC
jgi:hypothetical protein